MYHWFNQHLNLGYEEPIEEKDFERLSVAEMTVWGDEHPRPEGGVEFEKALLKKWHSSTQKKIAADP